MSEYNHRGREDAWLTLPLPLRPRPGNLRGVAAQIEDLTGLGVQVLGGALVMAVPPCGKRAGVVRRLEEAIRSVLPAELVTVRVASIEMLGDVDDYATPDLMVCPADFLRSEDWLLDPREVALVVEVVPRAEKARDVSQKNDWYAVAGVRTLLVIDPRHGTWALHGRPWNGAYQQTQQGMYGEDVFLALPIGLSVATDSFPLYGTPGPS